MAKTRQQKQDLIKYYGTLIDNSNGIIFTDNPGLKVNDVISLRKKLSEIDAQYHILKNKLFKLAADKKYTDNLDIVTGTTAAIFAFGEITEAAKILKDFLKGLDKKSEVKGGILENKAITETQVKELANLPTKNELLSKMLAGLNSPVKGFMNVLTGNIRNFIYVLNSIKEQK